MFGLFKSVFMAGMQPGQGRVLDVDQALTELEKRLLNISDAVLTTNPFESVTNTGDSNDQLVSSTPQREIKAVRKR